MSDLKVDGVIASTGTNTNLTLQGKGSGKVAIGDGALLFPDADGSANQVIETNASGVLSFVTPSAGGFTLATEQATTSGASHTFSSIPTGTTMIVLMFEAYSSASTGHIDVQIGDSGGIETTGYLSGAVNQIGGTGGEDHETGSFHIQFETVGDVLDGQMILCLKDSSNFTWTSSHQFSAITAQYQGAGSKSLSAELTQLKITGVGNADSGSINIMYQ